VSSLLENQLIYHALIGAAIVAAFCFRSTAVRSIVGFVGHTLIRKTVRVLDDRILEAVQASSHPSVLATPSPQVYLTGVTVSALQVTLTARCSSFADQFGVETMLREQAYSAYRERQIPLPVLERIVHVKSEM
jgi:hypothetical protein